VRLFERIADRIHARGDTAARAQGLTVTRLPGGRRSVRHPGLPALLEARRAYARAHGLDPLDRRVLALDHLCSSVTSRNAWSADVELAPDQKPATA
jgi:hypothetical protein